MKVTPELVEMMAGVRRERGWSYQEMARRSGLSWEAFRKIENVMVSEIREDTAAGICRLLGISRQELNRIADGHRRSVMHDNSDIRVAEALLRWVRKDENRKSALKAMGYIGDL